MKIKQKEEKNKMIYVNEGKNQQDQGGKNSNRKSIGRNNNNK